MVLSFISTRQYTSQIDKRSERIGRFLAAQGNPLGTVDIDEKALDEMAFFAERPVCCLSGFVRQVLARPAQRDPWHAGIDQGALVWGQV